VNIDKDLIMSDDQDIGQVVGDYNSTIIDQIKDGGPFKKGMFLFLKISEAVVGTSSTVQFALHTSDDNFSADDDVLYDSGAIAEASLTINTVIAKIPVGMNFKRYIKMVYSVAVATTTAGTVHASLVGDVDKTFDVS